jgi:hypothetical protein
MSAHRTDRRATFRRLVRLALAGVSREFPCNPAHVLANARDLRRPRELHPAFYGCFDWHSAVHGHWLLAHIAARCPQLPEAPAIRAILRRHLSAANLAAEARYLERHPGFERPYGWAWGLKLASALPAHAPLRAFAGAIERRYLEWLPKQTYPIRSGTHTNTAFGLAFALDYARAFGRKRLESLVVKKSLRYYGGDANYPASWEPGGNDFFSPCLIEADLMQRVLQADFPRWFRRYLPEIPASLLVPAKVTDRRDGQLAHLDGLNLSRAWCLFALVRFSGKQEQILKSARNHLRAGLAHVASGSYAGEHWLATFAALALERAAEAQRR